MSNESFRFDRLKNGQTDMFKTCLFLNEEGKGFSKEKISLRSAVSHKGDELDNRIVIINPPTAGERHNVNSVCFVAKSDSLNVDLWDIEGVDLEQNKISVTLEETPSKEETARWE